jgi:hypothetical protein
VLAVVEHDQRLGIGQMIDQQLYGLPPPVLAKAEGRGDDLGDETRLLYGGQLHPPDAGGKIRSAAQADLDGEATLADPAHAGDRHQTASPDRGQDVGELAGPADEGGQRRGQVARGRIGANCGGGTECRGRRRAEEIGIVVEDGPMHRLKLRPGVEPELIGQLGSGPPERRERVALPPRPVEGRHEVSPQRFPQRLFPYRRFEFTDDLRVPPLVEFGLDARLPGLVPQGFQPPHAGRGEGFVMEFAQGRATPQRQPGGEMRERGDGVTALSGREPVGHQLGEAIAVELVVTEPQDVPAGFVHHAGLTVRP